MKRVVNYFKNNKNTTFLGILIGGIIAYYGWQNENDDMILNGIYIIASGATLPDISTVIKLLRKPKR